MKRILALVVSLVVTTSYAQDIQMLKNKVDKYVDLGETWLSDRLQMHWNTCATINYINGEYYDHAGGEKAPAPTVMLSGARSHATNYQRPKLEEIEPKQEDLRGMWLRNKVLEGEPYEWASISKTGNIAQSINNEILSMGRDASIIYKATNDEKYAKVAASIIDVYLTGIYYTELPYDLNHGHQQTLMGLQSFEVIHENTLSPASVLYGNLRDYLEKISPNKIQIYDDALRKWMDIIIAGGVPHNNWNLYQAHLVLEGAFVLKNNEAYADGKGRDYYIDYILNQNSIRQWSLKKLCDYGYDQVTGMWCECPGYSMGVLGDFAQFTTMFDDEVNMDLTKEIPIIKKAAVSAFQYLFPDKMVIGFGDTHPSELRTDVYKNLSQNAERNGRLQDKEQFDALLKTISTADENGYESAVTPSFYAKNASFLISRNGMNWEKGLSYAINASEGNHMHANGISLELYGRGLRLAPDAGIGQTLYSGQDYLEWYSQFPSHNTVCVDGVSSYPVMKSCHSFKVLRNYPEFGQKTDYKLVQYSEVYFREPETMSDQTRLVAMISTGEGTGYYVDIFRSHKVEGGDKLHDYFYHNMGQDMEIVDAETNQPFDMKQTDELAFAGAHLSAYSYMYDKTSITTDKNIKVIYTIHPDDSYMSEKAKQLYRGDIKMTQWMKGSSNRTIFKTLAPMTEGLSRCKDMPYDIKKQPTLTFVARQEGEAWNRPFVSIFEPSSESLPGTIKSVSYPTLKNKKGDYIAIEVAHYDGHKDLIIYTEKSFEVYRDGKKINEK